MGADLAYLGTRFIATAESMAQPDYKAMLVRNQAAGILYTPAISGVNANFMRESIQAAGLDPDNLAHHGKLDMNEEAKVWKNIWSAGHGVGAIEDVPTTADLCARLLAEYRDARAALEA
jgi:nitronate monooxygenase